MRICDTVTIVDCYETEWAGIYLDGELLYQSDGDFIHIPTAHAIFNDLGCNVHIRTCPKEVYYDRQANYNDPYPARLRDFEDELE